MKKDTTVSINPISKKQQKTRGKKKNFCSICGKDAYGKGYCRSHYEKFRRGTLNTVRKIEDLPNEEWLSIEGHTEWYVSSKGRVKSLRSGHEKILSPRFLENRLSILDHKTSSRIYVHLAVLQAFKPNKAVKSAFKDNNPLNCDLDNLYWITAEDKKEAAIEMARHSKSKWANDFKAFWEGDKNALNTFFIEMRKLLGKVVPKRVKHYSIEYSQSIDDIINEVLGSVCLSISASTLTQLDNITSYVYKVLESTLIDQAVYSGKLSSIYDYDDDGKELRNLKVGDWKEPSAELVAIYNESKVEMSL